LAGIDFGRAAFGFIVEYGAMPTPRNSRRPEFRKDHARLDRKETSPASVNLFSVEDEFVLNGARTPEKALCHLQGP